MFGIYLESLSVACLNIENNSSCHAIRYVLSVSTHYVLNHPLNLIVKWIEMFFNYVIGLRCSEYICKVYLCNV